MSRLSQDEYRGLGCLLLLIVCYVATLSVLNWLLAGLVDGHWLLLGIFNVVPATGVYIRIYSWLLPTAEKKKTVVLRPSASPPSPTDTPAVVATLVTPQSTPQYVPPAVDVKA